MFNNIGNDKFNRNTNGVSNSFNSNSNELTAVFNNNNSIPNAFFPTINSVSPGISNIFQNVRQNLNQHNIISSLNKAISDINNNITLDNVNKQK